MVCQGLEIIGENPGVGDLLGYPTSCYPYFYAVIMVAIFIILSFNLFRRDQDKIGKGDMISSMGVSALAIAVLSTILTFIGPNILPREIYVQLLVGCLIFIVLWLIKKE